MACGNKEKRTDRKRYFILIDIRTHKSLNSRKKTWQKRCTKPKQNVFKKDNQTDRGPASGPDPGSRFDTYLKWKNTKK